MFNVTRPIKALSDLVKRCIRHDGGSVGIIVAISVVPLMLASGLAVDLSRAYLVQSRLAHSLDAAGLAVGSMRSNSTSTTYLENQFNKFFTANYSDGEIGAAHDLTFVDNGGIISVSGKATVDTIFMRIVGINTVTVGSSAEIKVETQGLELVMVLDNTGSMGSGGKLGSLKTASLDLIDILFQGDNFPDFVKVGLVPFSGSVNIGSSNTWYTTSTSAFDWGPTDWDGCVEARAYPHDVQDTDTGTGGDWTPLYWADHDSYNNWDRGSWYSIDYSPPSSKGPNKECPRPVTPLTNDRAHLVDELNAMWASGYTHINYGAVWGWRVISPSAPFTEGANYGDPEWHKAVIILTDGANTTSNSHYTAFGYRSEGRLGSTTSTGTTAALNTKTAEVCENMKAQGITVYTITFNVSSVSTQNLFRTCASSPDRYFNSPDSQTLTLAFRAIGAELKNLHLSK
ncbi:pilus assembly protein TadG-related protein [Pseudomonadota bacterium]